MICDDYEGDQISLITAFNEPESLYIGHLETPNSQVSLDRYKEWEKEETDNLLCLSHDLEPMKIKHTYINEVVPFRAILEEVEKEMDYKLDYKYWLAEIKGYSFHEILHKLMSISILEDKRLQLFTAKEMLREYFRNIIDNEVNNKCAK
ncbi:hypothetical protein ACU3L3_07115 [Priestia endophytica]